MTDLTANIRALEQDLLLAMRAGYERQGNVYSMEIASELRKEIVRRANAQFRAARKQVAA